MRRWAPSRTRRRNWWWGGRRSSRWCRLILLRPMADLGRAVLGSRPGAGPTSSGGVRSSARAHPDARGALVMTPYGTCTESPRNQACLHDRGLPLIADEAWGSASLAPSMSGSRPNLTMVCGGWRGSGISDAPRPCADHPAGVGRARLQEAQMLSGYWFEWRPWNGASGRKGVVGGLWRRVHRGGV